MSDVVALWFVVPICLAIDLGGSYLAWRRDADLSRGIVAFTGPASVPGYHAFMLPGTAGMTLTWVAFVLTELTHHDWGAVKSDEAGPYRTCRSGTSEWLPVIRPCAHGAERCSAKRVR